MFMKSIYRLALAAVMAAFSLQSCLYDKLEIETPDNTANNDGKCYMSLRFDVKRQRGDRAKTRTFQPSYGAEPQEEAVTDFRIFLVSRTDKTAPVIELENLPMENAVTTKPFPIDKRYVKGYQLYIVANTGGEWELSLDNADSFRGVYKLGTKEEECAHVWQPNKFVMANVNNEASDILHYENLENKYIGSYNQTEQSPYPYEDKTPDGGVPINIDNPEQYTYSNPYHVEVNIERVAAKVVVDCSKENYDFSGSMSRFGFDKYKFSDVHVDGVALINCSNSTRLVQKWMIACYQGERYFDYERWKIRKNPDNNYPDNAPYGYPYLWPITPGGSVETVPLELYYNQLTAFTDSKNQCLRPYAASLFKPLDGNKQATMYCLENASPLYLDFLSDFNKGVNAVEDQSGWDEYLKEGMKNRVTGVLFRVRAKLKTDSHTTEDLKPDPETGKWDKAKTRAAGDEYRTFYCYNASVTPYLDELIKEEPGLAAKGITTSSTIKQLRDAGVRVFEDGYMYYIHWIKDQNYQYFWNYVGDFQADEGWPFKYYAVMRNTRYDVNVGKISLIGMDLPGRDVHIVRDTQDDVIEGNDYLLMPTNTSGYSYDRTIIDRLKNKHI